MKKNDQETPQIDANRRWLTKAGLAAPAVLGTLASRQVLGAAPYQCTMSGQISGNISVPGVNCSTLGLGFSGYSATGGSSWPACTNFFQGQTCNGTPLNFGATPSTLTIPFAGVFTVTQGNQTKQATVLQVYNNASGLASTNGNITIEFGREAVLALLNAFNPSLTDYPLQPIDVVTMFNAIAATNSYNTGVINNTIWNGSTVLWYWKSLHS